MCTVDAPDVDGDDDNAYWIVDEADGDVEIKVYFQCDMEEDVVLYVVCGFVVAQDDDDD